MPCCYQEEKGDRATRHVQHCAARHGGECNQSCAQFYRQNDSNDRGTPEERHEDEERRLAHVAATRAKDRLVFTSCQLCKKGERWVEAEQSSYEELLTKLPADVFRVVSKDGAGSGRVAAGRRRVAVAADDENFFGD